MKKLWTVVIFVVSSQSFAASEEYRKLKIQIDDLENSLIENFDVDMPEPNNTSKIEFTRAMEQINGQYKKQRDLFYRVENDLVDLKSELAKKNSAFQLMPGEKDKLINSIDYANRIILSSRKAEVEKIYQSFKTKLSHIPKLEEIHGKLAKASNDDCPIKNLFFDKFKGILSFAVAEMNFVLTQGDVSQGSINSEVRGRGEFVTQFQSRFPSSQGTYSFTLTENAKGRVTGASFHQMDAKTHWVEFMGYSFGEQKENRKKLCHLAN